MRYALLLLLLIGCGSKEPNPCKYIKTPTKLYMKCGDKLTLLFEQPKYEPAPPPPILDPVIPIVIEPDPPPVVVVVEPDVDELYLQIRSFTLYNFNFINLGRRIYTGESVFESSNERDLPGIGWIYAKVFILDGQDMRLEYYRLGTGERVFWSDMVWTISPELVFMAGEVTPWRNLNAILE